MPLNSLLHFLYYYINSMMGAPKGTSKSRFHAGFLHKSRQTIAGNSCLRKVYPITLDAKLIFHAITQLFSSNSRFHFLKYVESRHHASPLVGPYDVYPQREFRRKGRIIFNSSCMGRVECVGVRNIFC